MANDLVVRHLSGEFRISHTKRGASQKASTSFEKIASDEAR